MNSKVIIIAEAGVNHNGDFENAKKLILAAANAGADYVKTSTGYAPTGATIADIKLMRSSVSPKMKIKSAGGVRTLDVLMEYLDAGISRSGATTTSIMLDEYVERFGRD